MSILALVLVMYSASAGAAEPASRSERERIEKHLVRAEEILRARDVDHLDVSVRERRTWLLEELARYRSRGIFPKRNDDSFEGRRPRFIDHRGVHCAVGHLIAASGHPALARAIADRFEYAYVADMDAPELAAWAASHGFLASELAIIQPRYDPPRTEKQLRAWLEYAKDDTGLLCARQHPPLEVVRVRARRDDHGRLTVTTSDPRPYARCFAAEANRRSDRGGDPFDFELELRPTDPQTLLTERLPKFRFNQTQNSCFPRPGPLSRNVLFEVRVDQNGLDVDVSTDPKNDLVDECLRTHLASHLMHFTRGGIWRLSARSERELVPRVRQDNLLAALASGAQDTVSQCRKLAPPSTFLVTLRASPKRGFEIQVDGVRPELERCVKRSVARRLDIVYRVSTKRGNYTRGRTARGRAR